MAKRGNENEFGKKFGLKNSSSKHRVELYDGNLKKMIHSSQKRANP